MLMVIKDLKIKRKQNFLNDFFKPSTPVCCGTATHINDKPLQIVIGTRPFRASGAFASFRAKK